MRRIIILLAFSFLHIPAVAQITGKVFIVTRGGGSVKLGLVKVYAIPRAKMKEHLKLREKDYFSLIGRLSKQREDLDSLIKIEQQKNKSLDSLTEIATQKYYANFKDEKITAERERLLKLQNEALVPIQKMQEKQDALTLQFKEISNLDFFISGLSNVVSTTATTDADGNFSLRLKAKGDHAIFAQASRYVAGETEKYSWAIWCSNPSSLYLTNENEITTNPPSAVFKYQPQIGTLRPSW